MAIPQKVGLRRSNVAGKIPTSDQIELGELAFNTNDKKIYFKGDDGSVIEITSSVPHLDNIDYITFNDTTIDPTGGQLVWNDEEGTLNLGLNDTAESVLSVGMETLYRVDNNTGSLIEDGTLVMYAGTVGNSGRLRIKPWDGNGTSQDIMGIATQDISHDTSGYVTHFGKVRGIDTTGAPYGETWSDGDILYAGQNGGMTNVLPEAPNSKTAVAVVISAHASTGTLFCRVTYSSAISNDEDVEINGLSDGQVLQYNSANGRFENVSLTTDDVSEASNLYFTQDRARASVSASGDISYNQSTGEFSATTYKSTDFDTDFSNKSTSDLSEGSNLYFTELRAQNSISVSGDLNYSNGVISFSETYSTASELLTSLKTVDGSGSGLDADTLDALQASQFLRSDVDDTYLGELHATNVIAWDVSTSDSAHQRADARDEGVDSRLHWFGRTSSGSTSNFRHAWYDGSAYVDVTASSGGVIFGGDVTANSFIGDGSNLTNLDSNEVKTAYESNVDTNAYTDAEKSKLTGIESGATADQSATEIKSLYEGNANTNAFTDIEKNLLSKLEREKLLTYFL